MEKYLTRMMVSKQVEAEPNKVTKAIMDALNCKSALWLLGTKGSRRRLQGPVVNNYMPDQYMAVAKAGLLYCEDLEERFAFAPELDSQKLPLLMEDYDGAYSRRSLAGVTAVAEPQPTLLS